MSTAVAIKKGNKIVLAADTQTNMGDQFFNKDNVKANKIINIRKSYLAVSGWTIYNNITDELVKKNKDYDLSNKNAIFVFFNILWNELHESYSFVNDQCDIEDSPFGDLGCTFLLTNKSGIYYIASDLNVTKFEKYFAIGTGADYGLGTIYSLYNSNISIEDLAKKAIEAASVFDIYTDKEIDIVNIE